MIHMFTAMLLIFLLPHSNQAQTQDRNPEFSFSIPSLPAAAFASSMSLDAIEIGEETSHPAVTGLHSNMHAALPAQQSAQQPASRTANVGDPLSFGVGIGFSPYFFLPGVFGLADDFDRFTTVNVYFPVILNRIIRIEPDFGILYTSQEETLGLTSIRQQQRIMRTAIGLFYNSFYQSSFAGYAGIRGGVLWSSEHHSQGLFNGVENADEMIYFAGAALGGEHFISRNFTIGMEVQANYSIAGRPRLSPDPPIEVERSLNTLTTDALLFLRMYF